MKTNNYSVLNVEKSLNSQLKTKNFTQKKVTHLQKDVLNVAMQEKQEATAAADLEAASAALKEKEENTL